MSGEDDTTTDIETVGDLRVRSEDIGFATEELIACERCARPNSPTRETCLYCGHPLRDSIGDATDAPELEDWEPGFNLVITDFSGVGRSEVARIASLLKIEPATLELAAEIGRPVPIARLASAGRASSLQSAMSDMSVTARVIADESLELSRPSVRLRRIEFGDSRLNVELFGTGETVDIDRDHLLLIFVGVKTEERTEEVKKQKRKATKTLADSQTSETELVVEIYSARERSIGWRIPTTGFDFSCLGETKSLLSAENMSALVERLTEFAPNAVVCNDYEIVRPVLDQAWPIAPNTDTRRSLTGYARKELTRVVTIDNERQLLRYSRLQRQLV